MAKDRNGSVTEEEERDDRGEDAPSRKDGDGNRHGKSKRKHNDSSHGDLTDDRPRNKKSKKKSRSGSGSSRRGSRMSEWDEESPSCSESLSESGDSRSDSDSAVSGSRSEESEGEARRRKRRRREKEHERERKRRKEKEKERKRGREEEERRRRKKDKDKKGKKKKVKEKDIGKKGAVTNLWGKYGIIRETDMWNKRPEFTAWLAEVKQVNLETLANWEEKQMFKEFMEDHNTATFPSKKYYSLDAYHRRKIEKEIKKGYKKVMAAERTVFDDEEQRRQELLQERERQKEEQVENLKRSMQSGMAQAMKEQARLREEMAFQYRVGNFEAAAAIQKRLDPDAPP